MDNVYNDLENYDDVDAVNKLTAENAELKHKLEGCNRIIKKLQEDFDNLEAEFKQLEKNYSSLLKISRAEIQRKTELITSLNIEKDLLVIKAVQTGPAHKVQKLLRTIREGTEVLKKKKTRNKVDGPKGRQEMLRRKSDQPLSPASSTTTTTTTITSTTDSSNKFTGSEKVTDKNKPNRTIAKENDAQNNRNTSFPDNRPSSPVTDKRVSALSHHLLPKLSSDEEFEDMYTALKPKSSREPDRNRKRSRDDSPDGKVLNNNLYSKPYSDPFRDRFSKNKSSRISDNERIMNRDKHHNESDKCTNRAKQYNNDRSRNASDLQKRFSPERHRRGPMEVGSDRYRNKRAESPPRGHRRLESPEQQKHKFKKISKRRKSYHGRDREYRESDALGYPETTIHGAYGEPLNKKPRIEPYAVHQDEKMPNEKQLNIVQQVEEKPHEKQLNRVHLEGKMPHEKQLNIVHQDEKMPYEKQLNRVHQDEKMPHEKQLNLVHQDEKMPDEKQLNSVHQDEKMPHEKQLNVVHQDEKMPYEKQLNRVHQDENMPHEKQLNLVHQDEKMPHEKPLNLVHQNEIMPQEKQLSLVHQDEKMPHEKQLNRVHQDEKMLHAKQLNLVHQNEKMPHEKQLNRVHQDEKMPHEKQLNLVHQNEIMPQEKQLSLVHQDEKMPHEKQLNRVHQDEKMPHEKQLNLVHQDEKMPHEKQCDKDSRPPNMDSRTCQPPDLSHTEESSNEPVTAHSDIGSTASFVFDDPRRNSKLYVKCTASSGDVLQSANSNEIYLQPVNKTLWNLQEVEVPKVLGSKPAEISEELVDNMDIDKNISVASLESGEVGSETTDTALDDNTDLDYQEFNQQKYNDDSNESLKKKDNHHKENSFVDNSMPNSVNNELREHKSAKVNNGRTGQLATPTCKNSHEVDTKPRQNNTQIPSILQKLIHSMNEKKPDLDSTDKFSNNKQEKEPKQITESKISNQIEKTGSKSKNINKLELNKPEKNEKITARRKEKDSKHFPEIIVSNNPEKAGFRTRDKVKNKNVSISKTTHELDKEIENHKEKELKKVGVSKPEQSQNKNKKATIKSIDDVDPKNVSVSKTSNNPDKGTKHKMEKEPKRNGESRISVRTENTSSKPREVDHKHVSKVKTKHKHETETENDVTIFREFEHRVYSRHIVEGDLELSDESNDETQVKTGDKITVPKIKISKQKSHQDTSKDKKVNSEENTRKTRSQKDKEQERKSINKFSELFGDSSSLITPEDLNLATRTAHGLPADCCPPAAEDARDTIIETETPFETQTTKVNHKAGFKNSLVDTSVVDTNPNKYKPKKSTIHAKTNQNNYLESGLVSNRHKDLSEQVHNELTKHAGTSTEGISLSEENQVPFNALLKQVQNAQINDINENDAKLIEKPKNSVKSNKRPKTKGEKKEETNTNKSYNSSERNPNNTLTMNDDKENNSRNVNSEGNISNEMSRIFENTIVPSKTTSDVSEINKETPQLKESTKEPVCCGAGVEDVPNLGPVVEEPGLVKMIVISTGVQPPDSKSVQYPTHFNALASSTPAKDLSTVNISSEMQSKVNNSAQVSVTIPRDDSVSQPEADVPDMRITCYRRRRKVLKRE